MGPVQLAAAATGTSRDGGSLLAVHGRIDNAHDLAASLTPDGLPRHDASLLLAMIRHRGPDELARCRGAFALAFRDEGNGRLLLAADPLGRRTVFHARIGGLLVFSSRLRTLLALPGLPHDLDDGYLAALLSDVVPEPDATLYAAIRRVPAASTMTVGADGTLAVHRYWQPDWGRRIRHARDETYVEEARALLDQAVARQLRGPGPVVCELSAGLDSGAVAATAARLRAPATIHALTLAPPDDAPRFNHPTIISDERPGAAAVAALHPNMVWEAVSPRGLRAFDHDPRHVFLTMSGPARNVMNIGWFAFLMDRARTLGARAVLGGTLGNMTLSWNGHSGLATMARRGDWTRLWREASALGRATGQSTAAVLRRRALKPLLPARLQSRLDDYRGLPRPAAERFGAIHPDFARDTAINERRLEMGHDYPGCTETMRRRWLGRIQTLPPFLDPIGELYGVELRDPTADLDLLEFCFAVPDEQYMRGGTNRWLARRVLADRLPPDVLNETRRGFQCPEFLHRMTLQRDRIVEEVEALDRSALASRVLDVARMKRLAADWPTDAASTNFGEYGATLYRGLHVARFLRWIEGGNG
ncbi:asparagine synthase-related protein [Tistrella bauzanensis]|nr:asparagine synthase-related protein [Tistrella bauzanensis]